jgi:peptide subunit release factor 1 (eRF1)
MYEEILRRLASYEPGEPHTLSVYLDMRPHETGENPALRAGLIQLKDRLNEIEKTLGPRGPALESFRADAARITDFVNHEFSPETRGLALFACAGRELFEAVEAGAPFEDEVSFAPAAALFQLARLLDDHETAVAAVVDTSTARLFVTRYGRVEEVGGPNDKNTKAYRKRSMGGWSQSRYQRNIENNRADFAKEAAAAIEQLVQAEAANRLILAGDEVAIPLLQAALPAPIAALVHDEVLRLDIRAPRDDVQAEVAPLLRAIEADESRAFADRVISAVQGGGLGVLGHKRTLGAIEQGQVEVLLLADEAEVDEAARNELIRLAAMTSASVEVIQDHPAFTELGGVGGLLRYRL